ncbi:MULTISPECIES: nitrate reductase [unclassified Colwellia]|uniref:nitrate reductase n=1 Tax=unclassified Colwellia TaxID=196834 RepID=UPI0015F3C40F|nr:MULTISPECIES: nitrate reductase [unclassified Colwellia]MBA6233330.1 nitrate reductase [Colwellia sp. MB02u-7]MBA6236420.1 nitrate reductase [Colwellia sp. MB02u-11]MBA6298180.1 nitrate reductase [Colwellia sp. MB3u-22]MBA6311995.1 nitrate reductase [Colwellia sp. MB3u-64]
MSCSQSSHIVQSTCAYCGVGCGIDITVEDGKAKALVGTKEHPANFGQLCVKGTNLLATTDLTNRLLEPQINNQVVNWSTATKHVADKFSQIINAHGPDSVAFYVSGQLLTEDYYLANKLMKGYIGSGNIDTNSRLCMSSAVAAYKRSFGEDVVPCSYDDLDTTELLLITGSNAAWTHPVLFQRIERAKKRNPKMKVVVIDPRKTATCQISDYFLPLKPGSDAAFFNGLLNYLAENNGLDRNYIEQHTEGFERALLAAKKWSIAEVSAYCELDQKTLESVYQLFTSTEKVLSFYSMGINQSNSGVDKCQSIINCHLATGKIGKDGCGPFSITGQPNAMGGREVGGLSNQLASHMDIENPEHRSTVQRFWQSPTMADKSGYKAVDLFDAIDKGKVKAVWIMATNPMVSLPDRQKIARALSQCEFVVVSDCVENNDTLDLADVKLPATPWLEKNGTVTNSERRISRQINAIAANGQAKHDWQIIAEVATAMGFSGFDYAHASEVFREFAQLSGFENNGERVFDISAFSTISPAQYDRLKPVQWPVNDTYPEGKKRVYEDGKFSTPSGKALFFPITPRQPVQEISAKFPFILNSGRLRDQWHTMSRTGKAPQLTAHTDKCYLYINPNDAARLNIVNDEIVNVTSSTGQATVHAKLDKNQRANECFMPIHWNKQFASSANVSNLYASITDPISGQAETKHGAISLSKTTFTQFGQLHIGEEFIVQTQVSNEFWSKARTPYGMSFHFANTQLETQCLHWCQATSQILGEWIKFTQGDTSYIICMQEGQLVFLCYISSRPPNTESAWLEHVFSEKKLPEHDIQSLLSGSSSEIFAKGKQICSCYNIGEKAIINAIKTGCDSVEKLGKNLKCGTNCGSCKSELSALVHEYKINKVKIIKTSFRETVTLSESDN